MRKRNSSASAQVDPSKLSGPPPRKSTKPDSMSGPPPLARAKTTSSLIPKPPADAQGKKKNPKIIDLDSSDHGYSSKKPMIEYLSRRRKSKEENDEDLKALIKGSVAGATSVKKHLLDEDDSDHTLKFNSAEFWQSLLYESLPPVIGSPLAAIFLEGPTRAYHLINHRLFLPIDLSYQRSNPAIIGFFWILVIPMLLLIHSVWIICLTSWPSISDNVCPWEIFLAFLAFICRNSILSIKYAYYTNEELEGVRQPAPVWTDEHQARKLIGGGWRYPLEHQDLVEDELSQAQAQTDINLAAASFIIDPKVAKVLRRFDTHQDFMADNGINAPNEISSSFIAHQFIREAFSDDIPFGINAKIANYVPILTATMPNLIRLSKGQWAFGESHLEKTVHAALWLMRFFFMLQLFLFGYVGAHDFHRRRGAMTLLGKITQYPGVRLEDFLNRKGFKGEKKELELEALREKEKKKKKKAAKAAGARVYTSDEAKGDSEGDVTPLTVPSGADADRSGRLTAETIDLEADDLIKKLGPEIADLRLYVDLREGGNAFAWVLARRACKMFGHGYFMRVQAYVGVLFIWAVCAMIVLNGLFWSRMQHYASTPIYIITQVFFISVCVLTGISEASKLQDLVTKHRMIFKNEIFAIQQTLADNKTYVRENKPRRRDFTRGDGTWAKTGPGLDEKVGNKMAGPPADGKNALLSPYRKNTPKPQSFAEMERINDRLETAMNVLQAADELVGYQEETHMPITVMGIPASGGVYNSTIGILITFLVLAVEGYSSGGLQYSASGWATYASL